MRMRSLMTALLAGGLLLACDGQDGAQGPVGVDGAAGQQGPVGDQGDQGDKGPTGDPGVKGDPGEDGQAGACDEMAALEITGVTGLPPVVYVDSDSPSFTINVQYEGGAAADDVLVEYVTDGPELVEGASATTFSVTPEEVGTFAYTVYVTDGCTVDSVRFSIEAVVFEGYLSLINVAPLFGTFELRLADQVLGTVYAEGETGHMVIPMNTIQFTLWDPDDDNATTPLATTPVIDVPFQAYQSLIIRDDGAGGVAFSLVTDDLTPVADADNDFRLQAFHAAADLGVIDITDRGDGDALLFDNLELDNLSSEAPELATGDISLGLDIGGTGSVDYTYSFATGGSSDILESGEIGTAIVYTKGLFPALYLRSSKPETGVVKATVVTVDPASFVIDSNQTASSAPDLDLDPGTGGGLSSPSSVSDSVAITGCDTVVTVVVETDIVHDYRGDLVILLEAPDGTEVALTNSSLSNSAADYIGIFKDGADPNATDPVEFEPYQPLSSFLGASGNGDWTMTVIDTYGDTGGNSDNWNSWGITLGCIDAN